MITIELLRQFRIGGYAVFDFAAAFLGIFLLSHLLSKIFRLIKLDIPKQNWLFLTLPIAILVHLLIGKMTPMTKNLLDLSGHYVLKIIILCLIILGIRGIKIIKNKTI
jgi:hypothetical protein